MNDYNDGDVQFIQMMIPHHQIAVNASALEYLDAKSPDVKEWARAILMGQLDEIGKFRAWLSARGIPEMPPQDADDGTAKMGGMKMPGKMK